MDRMGCPLCVQPLLGSESCVEPDSHPIPSTLLFSSETFLKSQTNYGQFICAAFCYRLKIPKPPEPIPQPGPIGYSTTDALRTEYGLTNLVQHQQYNHMSALLHPWALKRIYRYFPE